MMLPKYSMGIGDRFAHQGRAQLAAFVEARRVGIDVCPVWNKSNREHLIVHSEPSSVRVEADVAVKSLNWDRPYFVDADHIGLETVDRFIAPSDFFTLDVADFIGKPAPEDDIAAFVAAHEHYAGELKIPGIAVPLDVSRQRIETIARKYLLAADQAGRIFAHVAERKGAGRFITEVSIDETDRPQTPVELFFILAALASKKIPLQTIAPKFTGRFNKGVDYVGDVAHFEREFNECLAIVAHAVREFGLPADLKLSVHSGSDKFSIYAPINRALKRTGAGLHLKTAGTTWLEELIGLATAGKDGLELAKEVYAKALARFDELCAPYAAVIDIDRSRLPLPEEIVDWTSRQFVEAVRHDPNCPDYNPSVRQLLHVGYKIAAQLRERFTTALERHADIIAASVTENIFTRHLKPIFGP